MGTTTAIWRPATGWGLLLGLLLALPSWAAAPRTRLDSVRQLTRWPLATQLRLSQLPLLHYPQLAAATARAWDSLARRPDLAQPVHLNLLNHLGKYYIDENQPSVAIAYFTQVLQQGPGDAARCSYSGRWLCYCYYLLRQPTKGLPYGQLAVRLLAHRPGTTYRDWLEAYDLLGDCASLLPTTTLASAYYLRVLHLATGAQDFANIAVSWTNLATLSLAQHRLPLAIRQLDSARQVLRAHPDPDVANIADQLTGDLALRQHRYAAAAAVLARASSYSRRTHHLHGEMLQLKLVVAAVQPLGRMAAALFYQQRLLELQDSLFEQTSYRHAQELQTIYETSRKEQQLARQQQRIAALQLHAAQVSRRTTLLVGGLLLLGLGLGGVIVRQRTRRQLALTAEALRVRTRIAADLHDEVGTLLTRVSLQAELLAAAQPVPSGAFERLLTNSRSASRTMRDIVWSIDAEADTVGALLDRMRDHLDQTATPAGLQTFLTVSQLADTDPLPGEVRQHLYLIFKEAVTNAARHAQGATALHVTLAREAATLLLTVTDNGQATTQSPRSSMGLRNMQQRAQALGGELQVGPQSAGGFQIQLRVPQ